MEEQAWPKAAPSSHKLAHTPSAPALRQSSCEAVWRSHFWWMWTNSLPSFQPFLSMVLRKLAVHASSSSGRYSPSGSSKQRANIRRLGGSWERNFVMVSIRSGYFFIAMGRSRKLRRIFASGEILSNTQLILLRRSLHMSSTVNFVPHSQLSSAKSASKKLLISPYFLFFFKPTGILSVSYVPFTTPSWDTSEKE